MLASKLLKTELKYDHKVNKITDDSKKVKKNDIFFDINGKYVTEAISNGAKTVITSNKDLNVPNINFLIVDNVLKILANVSKIYYKNISKKVILIGVTGTNGKTTTTTLVYKYFQYLRIPTTLIGSNGIYITNIFYYSRNTTPNILDIYNCIQESIKQNVKYIIMEVSSHAIKQLRVFGLEFKIVLFTNFTQDHLDYHLTMEDYLYTKGIFINQLSSSNICILNKDIKEYQFLDNLSKAKTYSYGYKGLDYQIINKKLSIEGSSFDLKINNNIYNIKTKLIGEFNIYNITSFIAIVDTLGFFNNKTLEFLNTNIHILGRMEIFKVIDKTIIIDYAHTPDGVYNVLSFLSSVKINKLYVVMGCGGSRDKSKRSIMGNIATNYSDFTIFTSDNPRDEDELSIINDIIKNCDNNYKIIINRSEAIREAINMANDNDIVAILGKGNEQFQYIGKSKIHYNDIETVKTIIKGITNE